MTVSIPDRNQRQAIRGIDAQDRGFLFGDGVFDTVAMAGAHGHRLGAHIDRLVTAAVTIGIEIGEGALHAAIDEARRGLAGPTTILRTTVTRGVALRGLWPSGASEPTIAVSTQAWPLDLIGQPATLAIATAPRNERSPLSRLKSLNYLDAILAAREAAATGADDALLLNTAGRVACTTIANLFILRAERLVTPPLGEGCLPGIMRATLLDEAAGLGLFVEEAALAPGDLFSADAVFLTNSVRLLRPVTAIAGAAVRQSPVTAAILARLRSIALSSDQA